MRLVSLYRSSSSGFWFWSAAAIGGLALCALFLWPTIDASYRYAWYLAKVDLGLETITPADPAVDAAGTTKTMLGKANRWGQLGARVDLLYLLYAAVFAATAFMLVSCIRTKLRGRVETVVGIASLWIVLFSTRSAVEDWSIRRHASSILPKAAVAASALTEHWPTTNGPDVVRISFVL